MATNVNLSTENFCNSPRQSDEFCNIYESAGQDYFRIVTNGGSTVVGPYTLDTSVGTMESFEYAGSRDLSTVLGTILPFFTLEHDSSIQCKIREWRLDPSGGSLDLYNTITKTTITGTYYYDCHSMSVEYHNTEFSSPTATGTGKIQLDSYDNIESGDKLLLGPSSDITNLDAFEYVTVTMVSGGWVYLDPSEPINEYLDTDPVSYYKNIYLFSDIGENGDTTRGSLYKLNPSNGTVEEVKYSGMYAGVIASAWSPTYQSVAFVKGNNILYSTVSGTYQISRSQVMTNTESNGATIIPVYDLVFDGLAVYRLQRKRTLVDDSGDKSTESWATYNYHQDTIQPYTRTIDISVSPAQITTNQTDAHASSLTLTAVVRDQFGLGLSGKNVEFSRSGDTGYFTPIGGIVSTDVNGVTTIQYDTDYYNPETAGADKVDIVMKAKTDGASTLTGSQYVWEIIYLYLWKKFTTLTANVEQKPTLSGVWPTEGSELHQDVGVEQIEEYEIDINMDAKSKFQFPGGDWSPGAPSDDPLVIRQLEEFESETGMDLLTEDFSTDGYLEQDKEHENDLQVSQTYVSRHVLTGHVDDVDIDQFRFIDEAIPAFWSYKNPVNTNIWIKLRPFAFNLNQSTVVFKVREISYAGDTGYIDVSSQCTVTPVVVPGGPDGLEILYDPINDYHHNAIVYVSIEVYDTAPLPNIIYTDYWFKIIPDYKAPYIENESPEREEMDVSPTTEISFDIIDTGAGVNISTLELFVNNRTVVPVVSAISGGYHVSYNPSVNFYYGQTVEVAVKVEDLSDAENALYDMWRFYVVGSTGPWIDLDSFIPKNCTKGVPRKQSEVSFNVYGIDDTGVDTDSIIVHIGGKEREVTITPIIYRLG